MTEILCRWLNEDVKLCKDIAPFTVAQDLSNGYLLGELLAKHGLQDDFSSFSKVGVAGSKLNNFTRIEPTLALLGIKFNTNMAKDIMDEKPGVATRLLYQLFIALGNITKRNLTSIAMETMRPSAPAKLDTVETKMYRERLKTLVPRQVDLDFDDIVNHYNEKQKQQEQRAHQIKMEENEKLKKYQQSMRDEGMTRSRVIRKQHEIMKQKLENATVVIPVAPSLSKHDIQQEEKRAKKTEAVFVRQSIDEFEAKMMSILPPVRPPSSEARKSNDEETDRIVSDAKLLLANQDGKSLQYMKSIKEKAKQAEVAKEERDKRRRRVLIEQFKAHEADQEAQREEMFVGRLMRQSQMERRIAVQLMHVRHEKATIKQNRIDHAEQVKRRREKDYEDALEREAELCRQAKIQYAEELESSRKIHAQISEERKRAKYQKHYNICYDVVQQIVEFSCKVCDYREITEKALPQKFVREWKALFVKGIELYSDDSKTLQSSCTQLDTLDVGQKEDIAVLDEEDFNEFRTFAGEWQQDDLSATQEQCENVVLAHILHRIYGIISPEEKPPDKPIFPAFPIRACVLGKFFCGKSTAISEVCKDYRIQILDIESLTQAVLTAFEDSENLSPDEPRSATSSTARSVDNEASAGSGRQSVTEEVSNPSSAAGPETKDTAQDQVSATAMQVILGGKVQAELARGKPISDELLVDVMIHAIRGVPTGTGWIMDGFPGNLSQAKLLEAQLTGYKSPVKSAKDGTRKSKKPTRLVSDPHPPPETPAHASGIDLVVYFKLDDDRILQRAEGRKVPSGKNIVYHEEFDPPPDGSYSGVNEQDIVEQISDESNDREQVQARLTGFHDTWSKVEKWYNKFNIIKIVDAGQNKEIVANHLKTLLEETEGKIRLAIEENEELERQARLAAEQEREAAEKRQAATVEALASNAIKDQTSSTQVEGSVSPAGDAVPSKSSKQASKARQSGGSGKSDKKSPKRTAQNNDKKSKDSKEERPSSVKKNQSPKSVSPKSPRPQSREKKGSRPSSKSPSRSNSRTRSQLSKTPPLDTDVDAPIQEVAQPPMPGSVEWQYVDLTLEKDLAEILGRRWQTTEETYIEAIKFALREIRKEKKAFYKYFYKTRGQFIQFLKRPDAKQEFVTQWQQSYNDTPDDTREDEETKAELHCRVEDLQERLWDICDARKDEAENERTEIMTNGWLEDHIGLLINCCITVMQADVDRYQNACHLVRDYYSALEYSIAPAKGRLKDASVEYLRLPLVELLPIAGQQENLVECKSTTGSIEPIKASPSKRDRPVKTPELCQNCEDEAEQIQRIPLVPRRPKSTEHTSAKEKKSTPRKDKTSEEKLLSPPPPQDLDERLIYDAYCMAKEAVKHQTQADENDAMELNHDDNPKTTGSKVLHKSQSKDKKSKKPTKASTKSRSPSRTKLPAERTPTPAAEEEQDNALIEEEKRKQAMREKCAMEYKTAIEKEGLIFNLRLSACKSYAIYLIQYIKGKATTCYEEMNDWLGQRYQEEMQSVELMTMFMKVKIEMEEKIKEMLMLTDKDFIIDAEMQMFDSPPPVTPPPLVEPAMRWSFMIAQVRQINEQFRDIAPNGVMMLRTFALTINTIVSRSIGLQLIPSGWLRMTPKQISQLCQHLSVDGEHVNWRLFLLWTAKPWPKPTRDDLMKALCACVELDTEDNGLLTREQYEKSELWFDHASEYNSRSEEGEFIFDRMHDFKQLLFDIFTDPREDNPRLTYLDMLMHFCPCEDPLEGLLRAMSLVTAKQMPDMEQTRNIGDSSTNLAADTSTAISLDEFTKVIRYFDDDLRDAPQRCLGCEDEVVYPEVDLKEAFLELSSDGSLVLPFYLIYQHPVLHDAILKCKSYTSVELDLIIDNFLTDVDR